MRASFLSAAVVAALDAMVEVRSDGHLDQAVSHSGPPSSATVGRLRTRFGEGTKEGEAQEGEGEFFDALDREEEAQPAGGLARALEVEIERGKILRKKAKELCGGRQKTARSEECCCLARSGCGPNCDEFFETEQQRTNGYPARKKGLCCKYGSAIGRCVKSKVGLTKLNFKFHHCEM